MVSTLLEQASSKAIDELSTNPQAFAEDFTTFPPSEQAALLREMGKRIAELKELEQWKRKWDDLVITMPTTDHRIHVEKPEMVEEDHERGVLERAEVRRKWHWLDAEPREFLVFLKLVSLVLGTDYCRCRNDTFHRMDGECFDSERLTKTAKVMFKA